MRYTDEQRAEMVASYGNGRGYQAVARQFGCSHNTVAAAIKAAGIQPLPAGGQRRFSGYGTWRRGKASNGYVVWQAWDSRTKQTKFLLEHRLIMVWKLGRELKPGENVHHVDGDRANNDPANLELWETSQPSGVRSCDRNRRARIAAPRKLGIGP